AVMQPIERLSTSARTAILAVEQNSDVRVDWLQERLGLTEERARDSGNDLGSHLRGAVEGTELRGNRQPIKVETLNLGRYGYAKRAVDITLAILLSIILSPLAGLVALLVVVDVGLPIIFWQKRPGRGGRPFK